MWLIVGLGLIAVLSLRRKIPDLGAGSSPGEQSVWRTIDEIHPFSQSNSTTPVRQDNQVIVVPPEKVEEMVTQPETTLGRATTIVSPMAESATRITVIGTPLASVSTPEEKSERQQEIISEGRLSLTGAGERIGQYPYWMHTYADLLGREWTIGPSSVTPNEYKNLIAGSTWTYLGSVQIS